MLTKAGKCLNCHSHNVDHVRNVYVTQRRHEARLRYCNSCDFLFLGEPHFWLTSAYEQEFFGDTGYVQRNIYFSRYLRLLFMVYKSIGSSSSDLIGNDLGTGLGMLPRLMRDYGYEFWGSDQYSTMQLIQPFVNPTKNLPVQTAFEVVEHLPSLSDFLKEQVVKSDLFVFSTLIREAGAIPRADWWYYTFEIGQHISFHSKDSLCVAFNSADFPINRLVSHGSDLHAFASSDRWMLSFKIVSFLHRHGLAGLSHRLLTKCFNQKSLTASDHQYAMTLLKIAEPL